MEAAFEFLEWLDANPSLREQLLEDESWDAIVDTARHHGYQFTEEDWLAVRRVFA
jgi:predicted ribosomally synthesized peptide with nif11-like leader